MSTALGQSGPIAGTELPANMMSGHRKAANMSSKARFQYGGDGALCGNELHEVHPRARRPSCIHTSKYSS